MNPPTTDFFANRLLTGAARSAYCSGREVDAATCYAESAERSREHRNVAAEMEAKRWQGNSLMWSARHEKALQVLLEVATCDHPEADPASVFGAKTDCIMLALFHAQASACRALIDQAAQYLAVIGKTHWRHRLDLLTCMLLMKQGRFPEAAAAIAPAYRLAREATDGPKYTDFAYLKWTTRPAFFMRQEEVLAHWENIGAKTSFVMLSDRLRLSCLRLLRERLRRAAGIESPALLEEAQQAAKSAGESRHLWDETFDIARALLLAGDMDTIARLPISQINLYPFERAAFEADLQINLLRRGLSLPHWDSELNWPEAVSLDKQDAPGSLFPLEQLKTALRKLRAEASREDERMETKSCTIATARRVEHVAKLLPWINFGHL